MKYMTHNEPAVILHREITGLQPLSVNKAWRGGPRYRTAEYVQFERDVRLLLGYVEPIDGYVKITLHFTLPLKTFLRSDLDNLYKCLLDVLVKCRCIEDDNKVVELVSTKEHGEDFKIEILIIKAKL